MRKSLIHATAAFALVCVAPPVLADDQTGQPDNKSATAQTGNVPPGYRLEKTVLCYEEHRPPVNGRPGPIKRHDMHISILVPQDDCLALGADGWLRVALGQCNRMPTPTLCEGK